MIQVISSEEFLKRFTQSEEGVAFSPKPDGNCLFTSFAMYWTQSTDAQYRVRSEVVKYAQNNYKALGTQKNTIEPFKAGIKSFQPGNCFRNNFTKYRVKTFEGKPFSKLSVGEKCELWKDQMIVGSRNTDPLPTWGDSESIVVLANLGNCRIFVLDRTEQNPESLFAVTMYAPMTENAKTVDISLWLRHDHFVIPSVDLKPFFGKKLRISETGVISEFGKIIEWLTNFEVPDQKPTTYEELVKKYHLHPEEVVKQKYQDLGHDVAKVDLELQSIGIASLF